MLNRNFPALGKNWEAVKATMEEARQNDLPWHGDQLFKPAYFAGDDVFEVAKQAFQMYVAENALHGGTSHPSLHRYETEIVGAVLEMLNILEGFDLAEAGFGSALHLHLLAEAMRRAFADRARYIGDPDFNPDMPVDRLISKDYARSLRRTISLSHVSESDPVSFNDVDESDETTHYSVIAGQVGETGLHTCAIIFFQYPTAPPSAARGSAAPFSIPVSGSTIIPIARPWLREPSEILTW